MPDPTNARLAALAGVVTLAVAGCGSSSTSTTATSSGASSAASSAASGPATVDVQVDAKIPAFNAAFLAYFPNEVSVHAGDTVTFTSVFRGEPHSVVLGSLVQQGLEAYDQAAAAAGPAAQVDASTIAGLKDIPPMLPRGPGDANQATAQPCFLQTGAPPGPGATPCANRTQSDFTGTESMYSSGWLPDQATFSVKLASAVKPGTYRYMCGLHRTRMTGKITVVDPGQALPSAADVKQAADQQLAKRVQALQPEVTKAGLATGPVVSAGVGSQQARDALASVFAPKDVSIRVGGSVTWIVFGPHTISFNASQAATVAISKAPDGSVHLNPESNAPAGGPGGPAPPPGPPPTQPGPPLVGDGGRWNGTGFRNSGIIVSFPPLLFGFKLTFTTAGTYQYKCLIHVDMEGTVKVG